jgi:hypothetical protein
VHSDTGLRLKANDQKVGNADFSQDRFARLDDGGVPSPLSFDDILSALQSIFSDIRHPVRSAWGEHIPFLFGLMTLLRPRRYVELGVHTGGSFFAACQAVRSFQTNTRCVAVDNWIGEDHAGMHDAGLFEEFRATLEEYGDFAGYIRADFDEAVRNFEDGSIDLLHIDGFHTMEAVRNDFETWVGKMSSRGVILFHDVNEFRANFGVWRFWHLVRDQYPHIEFGHGHGLGVLVVGKESPLLRAIEGSTVSLLSQTSKNFLQVVCGGVGQLAWDAAQTRDARAAVEAALVREAALSRDRMAHLEKTIDELRNSTSWKITKPLRAMKALLSRSRQPG